MGRALQASVVALKARGKAEVGNKTMLDVLAPVAAHLESGTASFDSVRALAAESARATIPMKAIRGRASFLGERSIGHMDPGARSSEIMIAAVCDVLEGKVMTVGIVIVSHSPDVAKGAADMVRQMVGNDVPLGFCGGNPDGGLGTSVEKILAAIDAAWSEDGVAILVDLGGAETNSEMAIEMLPDERQKKIVICNAPVVEGAVMAATEAWGGGSLADVKRTAEELSPQ